MEELTAQDGECFQLVLGLKELAFAGVGGLAKVEGYGSAVPAHGSGDTAADRDCFCVAVVAGPALAPLTVENASDGEHQTTPPAQLGPMPPGRCPVLTMRQVVPAFLPE